LPLAILSTYLASWHGDNESCQKDVKTDQNLLASGSGAEHSTISGPQRMT